MAEGEKRKGTGHNSVKYLTPQTVVHEILQCIEARGPWPFITRRVYQGRDRKTRVWNSRLHRKELRELRAEAEVVVEEVWRCLWAPGDLNWWIGSVFAVGSLLFVLGSVLSLKPELAHTWSLTATAVNSVYFMGSLPFTTAAYLQLYQAANASEFDPSAPHAAPRRRTVFGWKPRNIGWLSCALQFAGTLLFNLNTFDAIVPPPSWMQQDFLVWVPDLIGSMLFLTSGYLAFVETCHAHFAWKPSSLSWWVTLVNLLGCVGFMIAAVFAIILPGPVHSEIAILAIVFTLQGAVCFFLGSCLMLPESVIGTAS